MSDGENATPGQHGGDAAPGQYGGDAAPEPPGHHTEGIAVADLIAKVTGDPRVAPVNRRSADAQAPSDANVTVPMPLAAIADEMPNLAGLARARRPLAANQLISPWQDQSLS